MRTSTALWSEIVRGVRGTDDVLTPHDPAYQWSNGRTHYEVKP